MSSAGLMSRHVPQRLRKPQPGSHICSCFIGINTCSFLSCIKAIWENFKASEFAQYDTPHNTDDENVRIRISKWANANKGMEHNFFAV